MGDLRVIVEAALREISILLSKAKVSEATQREVRLRFLKLLGELTTCEEAAARGNPEPPKVFCGDIMRDIVNRAVDVVIRDEFVFPRSLLVAPRQGSGR